MRSETVEIYSEAPNVAVMRHPGRKFPGVLLQGDTLFSLFSSADAACLRARGQLDPEGYAELCGVRDSLAELLQHYKSVLTAHSIALPFSESRSE